MTDLNTEWMGLSLRTPLVVAASPLSDDLPMLEKLVAAGAGAVVMRSLFEEQIAAEQMAIHRHIDAWVDTNAEARSFLPDRNLFPVGMEPYLAHLKHLRARLDVPVLASLNGATPGGWTDLAQELESAGASAIELNLYDICTDPGMSCNASSRPALRTSTRVSSARCRLTSTGFRSTRSAWAIRTRWCLRSASSVP